MLIRRIIGLCRILHNAAIQNFKSDRIESFNRIRLADFLHDRVITCLIMSLGLANIYKYCLADSMSGQVLQC